MDQQLQGILMQQAIVVHQKVELSNVLIGLDMANEYSLHAPNGQKLAQSAETGGFGGFISRQLFNNARAANVKLFGMNGAEIAEMRKPFRFIFAEIAATIGGQEILFVAGRTHSGGHKGRMFVKNLTTGAKKKCSINNNSHFGKHLKNNSAWSMTVSNDGKYIYLSASTALLGYDLTKDSNNLYCPSNGNWEYFINTNNLKIKFLYRKLDQFSWQYCNKGFFNFKNYIPKIITSFN